MSNKVEAPWSAWCSPWDPRCATEFYLATRPDKTCDVFKNYEDALFFLGDPVNEEDGTIHKVNPINRVYPQANSYDHS